MSALATLQASQGRPSTPVDNPEPPPKRLYKSTARFLNVVMPNGIFLHFKYGMFATDKPAEIRFLDAEIEANGFAGALFIDPNARTITAEEENPMLALRKKFFAEFQAEQAAKLDPSNDMGTSVQGKLNAASTTSIAPVTVK